MAITVPSAFTVLEPSAFLPWSAITADPLKTMGENLNWLYAHHSPSLVNATPQAASSTATPSWWLPCTPSLDGLTYEADLTLWSSTSTTVTVRIYYTSGADPSTATWTLATAVSYSVSGVYRPTSLPSWAMPAGTTFIKVTLSAGAGTTHLRWFEAHPQAISTIAPGTYASGFVPFNDATLAATRGAVHTEFADRIRQGVVAIWQDREHGVVTWSNSQASPVGLTARGGRPTVRVFYTAATVPPGARTYRVRAMASDGGVGSKSDLLRVGIEGGSSVAFDLDGVPHEGTIVGLPGDRTPRFFAHVSPVATTYIDYIHISWSPQA